jgi:hypothetical protein
MTGRADAEAGWLREVILGGLADAAKVTNLLNY